MLAERDRVGPALGGVVEQIGGGAIIDQAGRIARRELVFADKTLGAGNRHFRQLVVQLLDPAGIDRERDQIRVGKVAIVVGFLFFALRAGNLGHVVPAAIELVAGGGSSAQFAPLVELAADLVLDRAMQRAK